MAMFFVLSVMFFVLLFFETRSLDGKFVFAMLDVGQGDALFIQSPTGTQVLIDGGPPRKLLGALAEVVPSFDRYIDVVIMTHPDTDHIGGLKELLDFYEVGMIFQSGVATDSIVYKNISQKIAEKNILNILARKGTRIDLGGDTYLDILFPDRDVYDWETNSASVVTRLSFGNLSFLLTGDAGIETENILLENTAEQFLKSVYLKAGHHGSKTSSSFPFVQKVSPRFALVSAGKNNSYGHPHREVLDILNSLGVQVLRTDVLGSVVVKFGF